MCRVPNTQRFAANTAANTYSSPSLKRPFFADEATSSESGSPTVLDWQQEEALLLAGLGKVEPMIAAQPNSFYEWIADAPATENGMLADYPESLFESSSDSLLSLCQDDNTRSPFILPTHTSDRTSLPDFSWTLTPSANLLMTTPNGNLLMPPIALDTTSSHQQQQHQQQQQPQEVQQMMITPPTMTFAPVPTKKSTKSNKRVKTEHHPQPTKADVFEPASPADSLCDITDDMSPEEVKLIKRERNRLAAERYRRKGRNLVEKLQIRVDELTDENSSLRSEMAQMAEELRLVREMVKGSSISSLITQRKIFV